ncbi:hypothetical protein CJ030_MR8G019194 [Morella rubra]|uniref:TMV resistance protein N n=1 Tax=Morella rubra TaxID=262757 RepID=A0A6A1UPX5_9ROSI|nr:hypothetical protein CJ030_MR8G019194 [Morella rubra]
MEGCKNITSPCKQSLMQVSSLALLNKFSFFIRLKCCLSQINMLLMVQEWFLDGCIDGGIFNPGNDVSECCTYQNDWSSVRFRVPRIGDSKLVGFALCVVYSSTCLGKIKSEGVSRISITNHTHTHTRNKIVTSVSARLCGRIDNEEDHLWLCNFSQISFISEGDEVEFGIHFQTPEVVNVKKIGVCPLVRKRNGIATNDDSIDVGDDEDAVQDPDGIESPIRALPHNMRPRQLRIREILMMNKMERIMRSQRQTEPLLEMCYVPSRQDFCDRAPT